MKATVPSSVLPTTMAAENRLTSTYVTHVLFPKLGPLSSQRYTRQYARLLRDYAAAVALVQLAVDFARTYGRPVAIPAPPPPATRPDLRFEPVVKGGNKYFTHYIAGLLPFASARVTESYGVSGAPAAGVAPAVTADGPPATPAPRRRGGTPTVAAAEIRRRVVPEERAAFEAGGIWSTDVQALLRQDPQLAASPDGRLVVYPISPKEFLGSDAVTNWIVGGRKVEGDVVGREATKAAEGYAVAQILHGLAQPNVVIEDLLQLGQVNATGKWLNDPLATAPDAIAHIAGALAAQAGGTADAREAELRILMDQAATLLSDVGITGNALLDRLKTNSPVKTDVYRYLVWKADHLGGIDPSPTPLPDDTVIVGSREWAFRRTERLSIAVLTPTLRGPLAAEAVAPASELVTSESTLQEVATFREQGSARSTTRTNETATFSAATFRQALSHMAEEGINSEAAFSQDTTLFESLRERRREAIDRTVAQISTSNEQRSGVMARTVTSTARSYTTRGKDPRFATTEVSFQVAAPIDIEVRLEDVGLVWCPHMPAPFIALHQLIRDYEREARREYLDQNQIVDPVRPPELYETTTFKKEVGVRGNRASQAVAFVFPIPAGNLDWEFDAAATKVDFRNGTSADYNWDEAWNWDDLENWSAWIRSIRRIGNTIMGDAVLETTDPEQFNRGFLTFEIAMRRLTPESRSALEAYDLDRKEAVMQRQAVEVRANQYARLRRDEMIEQYENSYDLQEEAFSRLVKQVFVAGNPEHVSYWREILRSCVEWSNAGMRFEPGDIESLPFPHLPPSHFMNAPGIRFMLPISRSAEPSFFQTLEMGAGPYHRTAAATVREFVNGYRERVEELKVAEPDKLVLDAYRSELVLGRHLEAVLSEHPFAEPI